MRDDVSDNSVVVRYGDGEYTYPVIDSTVGDKGFDIGKLRAQTGLVTLDSGYGNTAAYKSAITYLDGEAGILRYRGYPIEQLAERGSFIETAYLLINGELPTVDELSTFKSEITRHTLLHEDVKRFYDGFPVMCRNANAPRVGILAMSRMIWSMLLSASVRSLDSG